MAQASGGGDTPGADGKVWAYYDVTDTVNATKLFHNTSGIPSTIEIDGEAVARVTSYTFATVGEHLVKFTPTGSSVNNETFRSVPRLASVYLPAVVTEIGSRCFQESSNLTYVGGLEHITVLSGQSQFRGCSSLAMVINMPLLTGAPVASFFQSGIVGVSDLGSITALSNSSDESGTFGSTPLTYCVLPNTLTTMNQLLFQNCPNLTSITIPASVTTMAGYWSPFGRSQISEITCLGTTPPTVSSSNFASSAGFTSIKVPASAVDTYKAANKWSNYAGIIQAIP